MLKVGDKIVLVKPRGMFDNVGEVCPVTNVLEDGNICFSFGDGMHLGFMSEDEFEKYFEPYVEPKKHHSVTVTQAMVDYILDNSDIDVATVFDKCTVVACRLPNGFIIVESSACVDPDNYNKELGKKICMKKIEDMVWDLEGYLLQEQVYENDYDEYVNYDCEDCPDYYSCIDNNCDEDKIHLDDSDFDDEYYDSICDGIDDLINELNDYFYHGKKW